MASICCPIETEPRTLSQGQLHHAREAAAGVVQKMEPQEASTIFVEGLKPVFSIKEMKAQQETASNNRDDTVVGKVVHILEDPNKQIFENPCQCSCTMTNALADSPDHQLEVLSEPVSAPF